MGYGISIDNKELDSHFILLGQATIERTQVYKYINIPEKYHVHSNQDIKKIPEDQRVQLFEKYGRTILYKNFIPVISMVFSRMPSFRTLGRGYVVKWHSSKNNGILDQIMYLNEGSVPIEIIYGVAYVKYKGLKI